MNSLRSPKNKYQGVIHFDQPVVDLGSVVRFTSNDIKALKSLCERQSLGYACRITILENKAIYPAFDWQEVAHYDFNK